MSAASPLSGRHALITGAGGGIGSAIARALGGAGALVSLAGRRREPLDAVATLLPAGAALVVDGFDVTDGKAIAHGLDCARAAFGPVSILVNNAGEAPSASFKKTDADLWARILAVDLTGVYNVTHAALPDLKRHGSGARLINIASTAGLTGYAYVAAYCAARIPKGRRLGAAGSGFKIAMRTLDIFRASVAAAALGFARRALAETIDHARNRRMFGGTLADLQLTQAALGDMATEIDAAALLTYRAAWRRDVQKLSTTREAAMAKMAATETGQRVIDRAVQIFGGRGVMHGEFVESLYREICPLRIREGATEVQKLIVAPELLKSR